MVEALICPFRVSVSCSVPKNSVAVFFSFRFSVWERRKTRSFSWLCFFSWLGNYDDVGKQMDSQHSSPFLRKSFKIFVGWTMSWDIYNNLIQICFRPQYFYNFYQLFTNYSRCFVILPWSKQQICSELLQTMKTNLYFHSILLKIRQKIFCYHWCSCLYPKDHQPSLVWWQRSLSSHWNHGFRN